MLSEGSDGAHPLPAQLVNVIAPIMTEPGGGRPVNTPFALTSRYGRGMVLRLPLQSPVYETGAFGDVPVLGAVAGASDEGGVTLFAVNRDQATPVALDVDMWSLPSLSATSHVAMSGDDPDTANTLSSPGTPTAVACRPCCRPCPGTSSG